MSVLAGMSGIKRLPEEQRIEFEQFYTSNLRQRILPLIADFTLLAMLVNALSNIAIQFALHGNWSLVHPLAYLYLSSFVLLGIAHRFHQIRTRAPLMIYAIFVLVLTFAYRDFIIERGWVEPVYGLFLLLAFVGYITLSVKHSFIIILANFATLILAHHVVYESQDAAVNLRHLLSERYVLACLASAITSVFFVRWLFRNLLAMQFLLKRKTTQLEAAFKTIEETEAQLIQQQKYQALNLMAKGLLHEVINPVNSATQAIGFAQSVNEDEDVGEALQESQNQLNRINSIIHDLRAFSRSESTQDRTSVEMLELAQKALSFCQKEMDVREIEVRLQIPDRVSIECQPAAITQVFVNLLMNAIAALSGLNTERKPEIVISCSEEEDESVLVCVRDNGKGIAAADIAKVSDPFFTLDGSGANLGLGLSICETIMRHHSGSMTVTSQEGEWTEVRLLFNASSTVQPRAEHAKKADFAGLSNH